jgi:hypothetical protein
MTVVRWTGRCFAGVASAELAGVYAMRRARVTAGCAVPWLEDTDMSTGRVMLRVGPKEGTSRCPDVNRGNTAKFG